MHLRGFTGSVVIFCFVLAAHPVVSQAPQNRDSQPQTRPVARPGNGQQGRPQPPSGGGRPNPGGGNRPGPGNGSGNRPNPGGGNRPGPGGNNGRPPSRPSRPNRPPGRPNRPPQWGRPPQNRPSYNFRPSDRDYLHRYYRNRLLSINRARRPSFAIGGFFPYADIQYISPLPPNIYGYLPPPPPGYSMGYFDGYVVVYDPASYFIANVIDLLQ
jgi:hypothetical protein